MQAILGAGGGAGTEITRELSNYTKDIRVVSRNPKKVNETDQLMKADLTDPKQLDEAVKGSEIVYVTIAFPYSIKVWRELWPKFMKNLIDTCTKYKTKIVFVDNMYMYDPRYLSDMTEETPINPISEKGKVRAEVARMLMNAVEKNKVEAIIARAPDFYGPNIIGSFLYQSVYLNLKKDKSPQWIGKLDVIHSYIFSKDIGKSVALLGNTPDTYNQVWHLPTTDKKLTNRQWIELMMNAMNKQKKIQTLPDWMVSLLGVFIPILKELQDVGYQLKQDYFFNSSKFNKRFNYSPISPEDGIRKMVR
ncbi:MAG: NAD-dependent epimerase/dehydratase family protein [Ignavibacterium album]|jgi:nucleoside-diphosphate-sugar epimerase|uniref:NAD-dependent epimerase/dehydratase family protein n=1 Tax=Ignavibacterium album TaxID=591197 RepID=UPI0026EDB834|nr:NAD-dependent epimerase/dehydratase family protein [Ignavibacterium album]MCX8105951.1 NAD-dependent epimerase/dehydratase family protein [Ignavibacterium album]